jgi:hypothetical protein
LLLLRLLGADAYGFGYWGGSHSGYRVDWYFWRMRTMTFPDYIITPRGDGSFIARPVVKSAVKEATKEKTAPEKPAQARETKVPKKAETWRGATWETLKNRAHEMRDARRFERDTDELELLYDTPYEEQKLYEKPF